MILKKRDVASVASGNWRREGKIKVSPGVQRCLITKPKKVFRKNLNETHFWYNIPIHFSPDQVHVTETSRNSSTHTFANCGGQENKSSMFIYVQEWYITFFSGSGRQTDSWLQKISCNNIYAYTIICWWENSLNQPWYNYEVWKQVMIKGIQEPLTFFL